MNAESVQLTSNPDRAIYQIAKILIIWDNLDISNHIQLVKLRKDD
jgi:hypothetical protein